MNLDRSINKIVAGPELYQVGTQIQFMIMDFFLWIKLGSLDWDKNK